MVDKVVVLIVEVVGYGVKLVVFLEVFVVGYFYWSWIMNLIEGSSWFECLVCLVIEIFGFEISKIVQVVVCYQINVVVGVNECNCYGIGMIYNIVVIIVDDGCIIGCYCKLVLIWVEKLIWVLGDVLGLCVYQISIGLFGVLVCGENINMLVCFLLLVQGELVYVVSYIVLLVVLVDYDMVEVIKVCVVVYCFEGKVFIIVFCLIVLEEIIQVMEVSYFQVCVLLLCCNSVFFGVLGLDGWVIGSLLIDEEGIVYVDIDLLCCIQLCQMYDIIGYYNCFDVFNFNVNCQFLQVVYFFDGDVVMDEVLVEVVVEI